MTNGHFERRIMKTVFITGASSGIGKAAAVLFQQRGWNVAATMRHPEKETELTRLNNVRCYPVDVTDTNSIKESIAAVFQDFGNIDVLVNNAGVYITKPFEMLSEDDMDHIINTNIIGTMNMIKTILPHFRSRKQGVIINISSVAGRTTFPFQSLYHSSKWAIEGMTEGIQNELDKMNIRVKMVEPGMVKTKLYNPIKNLYTDDYPEEYSVSFKNWHKYLMESFDKGYAPEVTARTIYKAASDNKSKLRYASGLDTKLVFLLRGLLPFSLYRLVIRSLCKL
jgi:NADP-dependent 3-hydroxy acid dehydrogenase YdfG